MTVVRAITEDEAAAAFEPLRRERSVLLAVSGGPDSMALMGLVARWREHAADPPDVFVATVNHGLRPEAAGECRMVVETAESLGLRAATLFWDALPPRTGTQEAARIARYLLLETAAEERGAQAIVTAHHADDQVETVLSRLLHGSGPAGLSGMRPVRRFRSDPVRTGLRLLRPCLCWPKARLVATAQAMGLPFVSDPSNLDPKYERTRLRTTMPRFEALGLTRERMTVLAARAARADDALAGMTASAQDRHGRPCGQAYASDLFGEPEEIVIRVLQAALGGATQTRLERVERLVGELRAAHDEGRPLRRTAAGHVLELDRTELRIKPESKRRRGRQ